ATCLPLARKNFTRRWTRWSRRSLADKQLRRQSKRHDGEDRSAEPYKGSAGEAWHISQEESGTKLSDGWQHPETDCRRGTAEQAEGRSGDWAGHWRIDAILGG